MESHTCLYSTGYTTMHYCLLVMYYCLLAMHASLSTVYLPYTQVQYAMDSILASLSEDAVGMVTMGIPKLIGNATWAIDLLVDMTNYAVRTVDGTVVQLARQGFDVLSRAVNATSNSVGAVLEVVEGMTGMTQAAINAAVSLLGNVMGEEALIEKMGEVGTDAARGLRESLELLQMAPVGIDVPSIGMSIPYWFVNTTGVDDSTGNSTGNSTGKSFASGAAAVVKDLAAMVSNFTGMFSIGNESESVRMVFALAEGKLDDVIGIVLERLIALGGNLLWAQAALFSLVQGDTAQAATIVLEVNDTDAAVVWEALNFGELSRAAGLLSNKVAGVGSPLSAILKVLVVLTVLTVPDSLYLPNLLHTPSSTY